MAARANQGYLISVIILVLLLLVATLVAFLGWSSYFESRDAKSNAEKKAVADNARAEAYDYLYKIQAAYIGKLGQSTAEVETMLNAIRLQPNKVDGSAKEQLNQIVSLAEDLKSQYDADMKLMIATGTQEQQQEMTWRGLVDNYAAALGKIHNDNDNKEQELRQRTAKNELEIKQKDEEIKSVNEALDKAKSDLESERNAHAADVSRLNSEAEKLANDSKSMRAEIDQKTRAADKEKVELTDKAKDATEKWKNAQAQLDEINKKSFDISDGLIVRVSPELDSVTLNIGSDDGLRPNQTFSIYDRETDNFEVDNPKASIEITAVSGPHQSVARVTKDDPLNPILTNDKILSPTWDPGYNVPIALAGVFDIDFDGADDRERLIQEIERNGGRVVASHDEKGVVWGLDDIDSSTRYFVLGDSPAVDGPDGNQEIGKAIKKLTEQAEANSVQQIDSRKLLNWMGRHGSSPIERMDKEIGETERRRSTLKNGSR